MSEREHQKARTRAAILSAARSRFVDVGYTATTIRDVADAAGVGTGTVLAHVADKRGLLRACFEEQVGSAVALGVESIDASAPLLTQLTHLAHVLYAAYAQHPELSRVMVVESLFPDDPTNDPLLDGLLREVTACFQRGLCRSEITRLPAQPITAAHGWFSAYLLVLVSGLSGRLGPPNAPGASSQWAEAFSQLLAVQLVGWGAPACLLGPPVERT